MHIALKFAKYLITMHVLLLNITHFVIHFYFRSVLLAAINQALTHQRDAATTLLGLVPHAPLALLANTNQLLVEV
jgi:hypothetical protein